MRRRVLLRTCAAIAFAAAFGWSAAARAGRPQAGAAEPPPINTEQGFGIFQQRCLSCHGNPADGKAPAVEALRLMSPERIYDALTSGAMKPVVGDQLTDDQRKRVAESIAGRLLGTETAGDARQMANQCAANPPLGRPARDASWNGGSPDVANTRFQPARAARLSLAQVPRLALKWAFGFPAGTSSYNQPTIVSGRVFVGADTGWVYSLDAGSGCVYWSFRAQAGVRASTSVGPISGMAGVPYAVYAGDVKANLYALDARTGRLLWETKVDEHFTTRITAGPTLYDGRLYVPVSSWEEYAARTLDYPCCTSVGSVVAIDANTGRQIWKTYVIEERPKPTRKNAKGVQQWAPAGGSIWTSPTVDAERGAIYVGTGDGTSYPAAKTTDAVMALDMKTGRILWSHQIFENDSFLVGCATDRTDNCPDVQGPDWDIPNSPILRTLAGGRRVLVAGTKPGDVVAVDPDRNGALAWRVNVSGQPAIGPIAPGEPRPSDARMGLHWGGAADDQNVYFGLTSGGMVALKLATGERVWYTPLTNETGGRLSNGAAAAAIPGVAFVGGSDGVAHAIATTDGRTLWSYATARRFDTVNRVDAKGGSIGAVGPTIVGGRVFIGSGYAVLGGGQSGNVLLAFGVDTTLERRAR